MSYNEPRKVSRLCVWKGKKDICAYFMLFNKPSWERDSQ